MNLKLLKNKDIILQKRTALLEVEDLMLGLVSRYKEHLKIDSLLKIKELERVSGKLTRGENHHGFPYRVIDFGGKIKEGEFCLFRLVFLWGHHFSLHLLASPYYLNFYEEFLQTKKNDFDNLGASIPLSNDEVFNWKLLEKDNRRVANLSPDEFQEVLRKTHPLRISISIPLGDYEKMGERIDAFLIALSE